MCERTGDKRAGHMRDKKDLGEKQRAAFQPSISDKKYTKITVATVC